MTELLQITRTRTDLIEPLEIMGIGHDLKWKLSKKAGERGVLTNDFEPLQPDKTLVMFPTFSLT